MDLKMDVDGRVHPRPFGSIGKVPGNKMKGGYLCSMIPLLSADQLRLADAHTIANEPISSINLMERAALACANRLMETLPYDVPIVVLAGMGNNGGDGVAMARILHMAAQPVRVLVPRYKAEGSPDLEVNLRRAQEAGISVVLLEEGKELPPFTPDTLVIDALFGTGLQRPITGWLKEWVMALNAGHNEVLAIDMPSGMFTENNTDNDPDAIVQADRTFTLELPKLSLLLADNARFAGDWEVIPIGLDRNFIAGLEPEAVMLEAAEIAAMLPERKRFSHKGDHGHAWILAGSKGKMGAAILAAKACLRSGCGLLTVHVPAGEEIVVHIAIPEVMVSSDQGNAHLSSLPDFTKATAIGVGPGIGTAEGTARMLKLLIQEAPAPLVLDADALNILSENKTWLAFLPAGSILTPHPKEFERLAGKAANDHERLMKAKELAQRLQSVVVLKGAYTAICSPDGRIFFNATGNPGMAKGGSGDALTGIITSLRAQGLDPLSAALVGVHAHGLAGDHAAQELGMDGMLPSDLIAHLPNAWRKLRSAGA